MTGTTANHAENIAKHELERIAAEKAQAAALWAACDFTNRDSIVTLYPQWAQETYTLRKNNVKNVSNTIDICPFTLQTPFKDNTLLKDTRLLLESGKRTALFGSNSTGKTLLFEYMIQGKIKDFPKHLNVHHCKELETHELSESVLDTVLHSHPWRNILLKVEAKLQELIEAGGEEAKLQAYKDNLDYIQMCCRSISAYNAEERVTKMLRVLGFDEDGEKKMCAALSGGLRMRVALCIAFFNEADLLLLDEPTNHLDFPSVLWLENRLRGYRGSFLLVTHDRELLNNVCTQVILLEEQKMKYYTCGFKEFEKKKALEDKKTYDEIEKFLQKNQNVDPSTQLGRSKHDKQVWSQNYHQKLIALAGKFTFPSAVPLSNTEVDAEGKAIAADDISLFKMDNLRFSYNPAAPNPVFIFNDPISFNCTATTRVGVMGPNGAGKSTFLKLLTHKLTPTTGTVTDHPNFTLAYFGQHSTAELDLEMTAAEFMAAQFPKESSGTLRNHLQKTGVNGIVADTRMKGLSYSQRSCVIFAKLTFVCPHLLIMDEPTNFLDLGSVDALISACNKYKGALLLVSHNRDFLKKCAKQYLSIVPGKFQLYPDLKSAEGATYTFIAEMENGGVKGADALAMNPGGGTIHDSQRSGGAVEKKADSGVMSVMSASAAPAPAAKPAAAAAAPAALTFAVAEKCQALWTDGKWYSAIIKKLVKDKYQVTYTQYGNTVDLPLTSLRKVDGGAAKPAATGAAGAAGAKPAVKPAAAKAPVKGALQVGKK
jgi:ATPase subunit of ABC transporter with duplicated ATPase domains